MSEAVQCMVRLRLRLSKLTRDDVLRMVVFTSMTVMLLFVIYVFFYLRASFNYQTELLRGVLP